ncbi:TetR/AcrR family transcriptional regulator [Hyphobacterium sp. CCMP332]|nr:TetR/AcrR family transcriptional regulator [Hyphobacterium sp. CCMP332]
MPRSKAFDKNKVLKKAELLFWKKGYHATSMQDLVDHLGINRASIYDTFGNKWGLFKMAFELYIFEYTEKLNDSLDTELDPKDSLGRFFENAIDESVKDKDKKGCFIVNTIAELIPGEKELEQLLDDTRALIQNHFQEFIKRGQEHGKIPKEKDPKAIAFILYSYYNGLKVLVKTNPANALLKKSLKEFLNILD